MRRFGKCATWLIAILAISACKPAASETKSNKAGLGDSSSDSGTGLGADIDPKTGMPKSCLKNNGKAKFSSPSSFDAKCLVALKMGKGILSFQMSADGSQGEQKDFLVLQFSFADDSKWPKSGQTYDVGADITDTVINGGVTVIYSDADGNSCTNLMGKPMTGKMTVVQTATEPGEPVKISFDMTCQGQKVKGTFSSELDDIDSLFRKAGLK